MKILFFVNPFETHGIPLNIAKGLVQKLPNMVSALSQKGAQVDLLTSINALTFFRDKNQNVINDFDTIFELNTDHINTICNGYPTLGADLVANPSPDSQTISSARRVLEEIGCSNSYDIVIVPFSETALIKELFPRSKTLFFETGVVCHLPFNQFHTFDPYGTFASGAYFSRLSENDIDENIEEYAPVLESLQKTMRAFSRKFVDEIGGRRALRRGFKKVVMVPLQISDNPSFSESVPFKSQFGFLEHVLQNTPAEIGVLVTEHPAYPQITAEQHNYLKTTYSNYIYFPKLQKLWSPSSIALPVIDAVVGVSSTVLFHAHALGIRTFSIGSSSFKALNCQSTLSEFISDLQSEAKFETPRKRILDMLARYSLPIDFYQSPKLFSYLQELIGTYSTKNPRLPIVAKPSELLEFYSASDFPKTLKKSSSYFVDQWASAPLALSIAEELVETSHWGSNRGPQTLHIAVVMDHFGIGGTQRVVQRLIQRMPNVHWTILVEKRIDEEFEQLGNCDIVLCERKPSVEASTDNIVRCLQKIHRETPISLFLNPMHWREAALEAMPAIKSVLQIPIIYWEHNSFYFPYYIGNSNLSRVRQRTVEYADVVVLLGEHDEANFRSAFPTSNTKVIRNPVPIVNPVNTSPECKENTVLVVGRFDPQKRMDRCIPIMKSFSRIHDDWKMVIAGDGYQRADVEAEIRRAGLSAKIELKGYVSDPSDLYAKSKIVAILSDFEGDPLTLMEAKAHGAPVVAFELFQNTRMRDGIDGFYAPQEDTEAFVKKLSTLAENPSLLKQMGSAARADYEDQLSETPEDEWNNLFSELSQCGGKSLERSPAPVLAKNVATEAVHVLETLERTLRQRLTTASATNKTSAQGTEKKGQIESSLTELAALKSQVKRQNAHIEADGVMLRERYATIQNMSEMIKERDERISHLTSQRLSLHAKLISLIGSTFTVFRSK